MKVAILGDALREPLRGIGNYTAELVTHLRRDFPENEYVVVTPGGPTYRSLPPQDVRPLGGPVPHRIAHAGWPLAIPYLLRRAGYDVVHSPGSLKPFWRSIPGARLVVTVHDLTPLRLPETHRLATRAEFRLAGPRTLAHAHGILVDSSSTEQDLRAFYKIPGRTPVRVVPLGVKESFFDVPRPGQQDPYFVCVGSIEPRKNLERILRAYGRFIAGGGRARLVCAGPPGWKAEGVRRAAAALPPGAGLEWAGHVPESELPRVYAGALALVFPSLYEGFGLPVLEAMAAGCPVVTSDRSSLPEVAGDAALLVDPTDEDAIVQALHRMESEPGLRDCLRERGIARARHFPWRATAQATQAFYDEVVRGAQ